MNRFVTGVLAATVLLGVLLWVVLEIVGEFAAGPREAPPLSEGPLPPPPGVTRIASHEELVAALDARGIDSEVPLQGWRDWLAQRGFLGAQPLLGIGSERARARFYDHLDDEALAALAAQSDAGALQHLAERQRRDDPVTAMQLYRRAAEAGSVAAMIELSALYDTVARMAAEDWPGPPPDPDVLAGLSGPAPGRDLHEESLAWLLAALRDGGEALATPERLDWAEQLAASLEPQRRSAVCSRSATLFLQMGAPRRAAGFTPVRQAPPPLFVAARGIDARDPCRATATPLGRVLELAQCAAEPVVDGSARQMDLWICPAALFP
ncbi:MAG: hypothetical protein JJT85_10210 [Chromatiales bacterium]|nr:hypothetical protein [Chromatiales bacterium]